MLLAAGLILPVLDGLDEIPEQIRGPAISKINDSLLPGERLVVTCRRRDYQDAVRPHCGVEVTLRAAAAVQLQPLRADAVGDYLCDDASGPVARARWDRVLAVLGTEAPAGQALTTPLMVGLARVIYNPRPGEIAGTLRDPAELCDPTLADRMAVESLLFDAFVPAAYRSGAAVRWTAREAERCLVFLARHLEYKAASIDMAWWQLRRAVPAAIFAVIPGFMIAFWVWLCVWITDTFETATKLAFVFGPVAGLLAGFLAWRDLFRVPSRGIHWRLPLRRLPIPPKLSCLILLVLLVFLPPLLVPVLIAGLEGVPADLTTVVDPLMTLRTDRRVAIVWGLVFGIVPGLLVGVFAIAGNDRPSTAIASGLVSLGFLGLIGALATARWPFYWVACIWLALKYRSPWPLMSFFVDAHRRGILRQVGALYQFRHIELQHRLANRDISGEQAVASSSPTAGAAEPE